MSQTSEFDTNPPTTASRRPFVPTDTARKLPRLICHRPSPAGMARRLRRGPARPITKPFQPPCLKFNHPILKFNQKSTLRQSFAIARRLHCAQITALDGASAVACHRGAQITARPGSSNNRTTQFCLQWHPINQHHRCPPATAHSVTTCISKKQITAPNPAPAVAPAKPSAQITAIDAAFAVACRRGAQITAPHPPPTCHSALPARKSQCCRRPQRPTQPKTPAWPLPTRKPRIKEHVPRMYLRPPQRAGPIAR